MHSRQHQSHCGTHPELSLSVPGVFEGISHLAAMLRFIPAQTALLSTAEHAPATIAEAWRSR